MNMASPVVFEVRLESLPWTERGFIFAPVIRVGLSAVGFAALLNMDNDHLCQAGRIIPRISGNRIFVRFVAGPFEFKPRHLPFKWGRLQWLGRAGVLFELVPGGCARLHLPYQPSSCTRIIPSICGTAYSCASMVALLIHSIEMKSKGLTDSGKRH